jgi:hypothetical protein
MQEQNPSILLRFTAGGLASFRAAVKAGESPDEKRSYDPALASAPLPTWDKRVTVHRFERFFPSTLHTFPIEVRQRDEPS